MKNFIINLPRSTVDFDLKKHLTRLLFLSNRPFWLTFATVFGVLNLIFLYHGTNFMFGDHDWKYFKNGVALDSGLFEGRFSQFLLINALTGGNLLPILNNTLGFAGFALGVSLLAIYWRLPQKTGTCVLFGLFTAVTPYILSFLYFAFLVIPCLSWSAVIISALLISERAGRRTFYLNFIAIALFTLALGGYPPVINLVATALSARVILAIAYEEASWRTVLRNYTGTAINFIIAVVIYKCILAELATSGLLNTSYYNLQTTPLTEWGAKFLLVSKDLIKQFSVTLPFIPQTYKNATLAVTLIGVTAFATHTVTKRQQVGLLTLSSRLIAFIALCYAPLLTLFISTSLAETEFSPRIDFFGLVYFYAAQFALALRSPSRLLKNLAVVAAVCSITSGALSSFEAQKVWKLGFEAEMSLYRRVGKRIEQSPNFNPTQTYIMVQDTSPAFRERFYHTPYTHKSDDLLSISYVPGLNTGVMWNYKAVQEYASETSYVYTFRPDLAAVHALQTSAPWPDISSVTVSYNWIMTILTRKGLFSLKERYNIW